MGGPKGVLRSDAQAYTQAGDADLEGNGRANTLVGNSASNSLAGQSGDDILNGRGGIDIAEGGLGNDTFVVDTATDQVRDSSAAGVDLVRAETDYSWPDGGAKEFIENLRMQGGNRIECREGRG